MCAGLKRMCQLGTHHGEVEENPGSLSLSISLSQATCCHFLFGVLALRTHTRVCVLALKNVVVVKNQLI